MDTPLGKKILVVDDSAPMRMLVSIIIKKVLPGISVTEAANGIEALEKFKQNIFDLILSDIMMPKMNGIELIRAIRKELNNKVPIIVITTKDEENYRDAGIAAGASGYLTKPVDGQELKKMVYKFLTVI
ncbi:MAG TPA: response regulator [bacterium]